MPRAVLVGGRDDGEEFVLSSLAPLPFTIRTIEREQRVGFEPATDEPESLGRIYVEYHLVMNMAKPVQDRYGRIMYVLSS